MYFGPGVNAARGVAMQVKNAVNSLCNNFNQAVTPQINKSYAGGDVTYMHKLIFASSKYTYYLLFIMCLPVILKAKTLLDLWLVDIPEHSVLFLQLILVVSILTALGTPLSNAAGANGHIRNFQLIVGGINLLLLPLTWGVFNLFGKQMPEWAFIIQIALCIVAQIARILLVKPLIQLSIRAYFKEVVYPCTIVSVLSSILPIIATFYLPEGFLSLVLVSIVSVLSVVFVIYNFGLEQAEKKFVLSKLKKYDRSKG